MTYTVPAQQIEYEQRYRKSKDRFLSDPGVHPANQRLYARFFEYEEYKLRRVNSLQALDAGCYKTLYAYVQRFKNVNRWFENKPLTEITKADIKRVYDGLEDGVILNAYGKPFRTRADYYNKIFRSKLFRLAGKDGLAKEVIEFYRPNTTEVRFILEPEFRGLVAEVFNPLHQLLFWLVWDTGENVNSQLQLVKSDFHRQINPETDRPQYRVNYRREILKRSRRARSEITNHPETVALLDRILARLEPGQPVFTFAYRFANKIMQRARKKAGTVCQPRGEPVTWKDLRSGMACDLLNKGWTCDQVNARLGHKPSSSEIDKYISFLALDRQQPQRGKPPMPSPVLPMPFQDYVAFDAGIRSTSSELYEQVNADHHQEVIEQMMVERRQMQRQIMEMKQMLEQARFGGG